MIKSENSVTCSFIACSCAKTPSCVDWNQENGWILFGSSRNVALISPESREKPPIITGTFCGHGSDVTCVKWIKNTAEGNCLAVSGGTDSRAILWRFHDGWGTLRKIGVCIGHSMSITQICGLILKQDYAPSRALICTCSADSTMRIWTWDGSEDDDNVKETQVIPIGKSGFALCCDMRSVGENGGVLLVSGHDDKKIRLYWKSDLEQTFVEVMTLSGHEDWIRGVRFQPADAPDGSILLASCSQDTYVRVWRLGGLLNGYSAADATNLKNECGGDGGKNGSSIQLKRQIFTAETSKGTLHCTVALDAVLSGHEDWVYSVQWHPGRSKLLTASMDKCLIIWEPDEASGGLWLEKTRLGAVGGPVASGFYGGLFGPSGSSVLGHTFQGGLHVWRQFENEWRPQVFPSGHFGAVNDVHWDVNGFYLLSCSDDQTTRLYAPWVRSSSSSSGDRGGNQATTVHEIARPQVHGFDMQSVVSVRSSCFVSCAEEKTLRAFTSTKTFAENYVKITKLLSKESTVIDRLEGMSANGGSSSLADGACVPSLGLSNKAVFIGGGDVKSSSDTTVIKAEEQVECDDGNDFSAAMPFQAADLEVPPTEDCLMQNTLWPEAHKLYGHGCEVFAVACNHAGTVIASAAKANKPDQAQVILWSTSDWQQRCQLSGHTLTVTQIAFSPHDSYLLTVSRDRTWCLYRRKNGTNDFEWERIGFTDKKTAVHTRIIWSCAWTPDSKYFLTASRDKKVAAWAITDHDSGTSTGVVENIGSALDASDSATAVAIFSQKITSGNYYLVAVGLESGEIMFYKWSEVGSFEKIYSMDRSMAHSMTVKRLQFRPLATDHADDKQCSRLWLGDNDNIACLASCSDDNSVKIFRINLQRLFKQ